MFNCAQLEQGLKNFRKYENSMSSLPTLAKVSGNSSYQKSYEGHSPEKDARGKEKESFFLKMNWALDPSSNYQVVLELFQKDYLKKNGE